MEPERALEKCAALGAGDLGAAHGLLFHGKRMVAALGTRDIVGSPRHDLVENVLPDDEGLVVQTREFPLKIPPSV